VNVRAGGRSFAHPIAVITMTLMTALLGCGPNRGTIGAMLAQNTDGELRVHSVPQGLAADTAGLLPNDQVLLIDGRDVRELSESGIHNALEGEPGSSVKLTILRGDEVLRLTVKRRVALHPQTEAQ
jgi:C-terminal processing protease CtpA/Prc